MKKMIVKNLATVIAIVMILSLMLSYIIQLKECRESMIGDSCALFGQVERILQQNERELEQVKAEYSEDCLNSARVVAYMVEQVPELVYDVEELKRLAEYLKVDEIHFFNEEGVLYAGSEPKYFNLTMDSGEQIGFFKAMLTDKTLELCQDISPNTAEKKPMQYSAVWDESGEKIIQIGMEPIRVLEITEKNELSYVFSLLLSNTGVIMYAADVNTGEILGSTDSTVLGKSLSDIGLKNVSANHLEEGFDAQIDGAYYYCYFCQSGDVLLGRACSYDYLYKDVNRNLLIMGLLISVVAVMLVVRVTHYLNINIVHAIADVNEKLNEITKGNLDSEVAVATTPEFVELSGHINEMVRSILETTDKLSVVLDNADLSIGVYEYGTGMSRVRATRQVSHILAMTEGMAEKYLADYILFADYLDVIRANPFDQEKQIFCIPGKDKRYVKIESFQKERSTFGMVTDVTETVMEQQRLERERDVDVLTGLRSRRALYDELNDLFEEKEMLQHSVLVMLDADNLKLVNDQYGHEAGDDYLRGVADCMKSVCTEQAVAARLGGDEFVLFLYGCATRQEAEQCVETLKQRRGKDFVTLKNGTRVFVQFSLGCAGYPEEGKDYHELLKLADERMYEEKRARKGKK